MEVVPKLWRGWLGDVRRKIDIVLVVFSQCGLIVDKLCKVNLFGLGSELRWLDNILKLNYGDIVHLLEFVDVSLDFRRVGKYHGRVFARLNVI